MCFGKDEVRARAMQEAETCSLQWPDKLYHYTSLESLALILENRTLRLMPLSGMDDPQEARTKDVENLGRFFFASCWTDDPEESIPMWSMYTPLSSGVRISLPPLPFRRYLPTDRDIAAAAGIAISDISVDPYTPYSYMPIEDLARGLFSVCYFNGKGILQKIEYTSDKNKLEPVIVNRYSDSSQLRFGTFGKAKNLKWSFQHEWRYLIPIFPIEVFGDLSTLGGRIATMFTKMVKGELASPCAYYDFHLDSQAIKQIEIVPSPRLSPGNQILLDMLIEKHGLYSSLKRSELIGLL